MSQKVRTEMSRNGPVSLSVALAMVVASCSSCVAVHWKSIDFNKYTLYYTVADEANTAEYTGFLNEGVQTAESFFGQPFKHRFSVYIHPHRSSLDSAWRVDWKEPDLRSECWMVASGVASKLDLISPGVWDGEACEHSYTDTLATRRLITHELVHVYHGQWNKSPDFSDVQGIDWFVEGLATYASGQCDTTRIRAVKQAIIGNAIPPSLDGFWSGKLKYGLSGSLVMYLDHTYGRKMVIELLPMNTRSGILKALGVSEAELLGAWSLFVKSL